MEAFPFVGNNSDNLLQKIFAINHIKKLGHNKCQNFSWRATKNNELFYIFNNPYMIIAETVVEHASPNFETLHEVVQLGIVMYKYNKSNKNFHIKYIETENEFKRLGIADQMLEYSKLLAKKLGARSITLDRLCTYTDGETVLPFRGDPQDFKILKELKSSGKKIIDINLNLYTKHGFIKQTNREPEEWHLVPMVTNKLKPASNKIESMSQVYHFNIKNFRGTKKKLILPLPKNTDIKKLKLFNYLPKNMI